MTDNTLSALLTHAMGHQVSYFLIGALLGLFFFSGLWWTVCQLRKSQHIMLLFFLSLLLRCSVVITGFYFFLSDTWQATLIGLLGFIVVRSLATRCIQLKTKPDELFKKTDYAP